MPRLSGSVWLTHEVRSGEWKGFGVGAGLFAAGEREGGLANSYRVPGYTRADASLFYRGNGWRAALGVKNVFDKDYIESPVSRARRPIPAHRAACLQRSKSSFEHAATTAIAE